jgi:hypothetical protein
MPTYHRSQRLRLVGTGPKVEQLQEGRFRLTFTCTATNPNEAWMNGNKDQIMTAYGTLQSAQKNIAGIDPRTDEAYSDMVLFKTEANPSQKDLIITLVYETATGTFTKAQDDKVVVGSNQLQTVERLTVAKTGTSLPSVTIGTTSITVNSIACVLTSRIVQENDAYILLKETYSQTGIISVQPVMTSKFSSIPMYQYKTLVASAKVIDTASAIQDPGGTNIQANAIFFEPSINHGSSPSVVTQNVLNTSVDLSVSNSAALIGQYEDFFDFAHPGLIELNYQKFGERTPITLSAAADGKRYNRVNIDTKKVSHPITTKVKCTVYNFLQRGSSVIDSDFNEGGAAGLWSPNSWASVNMSITKEFFSENAVRTPINNTYAGYRIEGSSRTESLGRITISTIGTGSTQLAQVVYNGNNFGTSAYGYNYELVIVDAGPPNPEGQRWCLGVDIKPAFRDSSGNQYYNKQIVVTDVIEERKPGQLKYT